MAVEFQLRRNPRARRVTLRVKADEGLVVTAPPRVPERAIRDVLAERADWIEAARQRLRVVRDERPAHLNRTHPDRIALPAVGRELRLAYLAGARPRWRASGSDRIELEGVDDPAGVRRLLVQVLKGVAREALEPRVHAFATHHRLSPGRITWRNPNTRWGSCSSNGNLSLSVRLLLLEPAVCDYVLLHELAHLEHPNHSRAFWTRVEAMCPDYRACETALKAASRAMPVWVTG